MPTLHFGFVDVPYPGQTQKRGAKGRFLRKTERSIQVAEELEKRYQVVENFSETTLGYIAEQLEYEYQEQLEELFEGRRTRSGPGQFSAKVTQSFRNFILKGGMDSFVRGVPTIASIKGTTWHPGFNKNPKGQSRPSFYDTGTYIGAFRAWID